MAVSVGASESLTGMRERREGAFSRIRRSVVRGLDRVWVAKRLILTFYIVNLICALVIALPFWSVLSRFAGQSLMGAEMATRIDTAFFLEFLYESRRSIGPIQLLILLMMVLHWLVSLFLSGGAMAVLASGESYWPSVFWGKAAKFYGRFIRLALWSIVPLLVLALLPLAAAGLQRLIYGSDPYQYVTYWGMWIKVGLAAFALALLGVCFDYARIDAVLSNERRMRRALWRGIRFTFRNPVATIGLALVIFLAGAMAYALYRAFSGALDASSVITVSVLVVVQQIYILWRMALRLTRYSSEIALMKSY